MSDAQPQTPEKKEKKAPLEALKDRLTRLLEQAQKIKEDTANWPGENFVEMRASLDEVTKQVTSARDAAARAPSDFQPPAKAPSAPALKPEEIEIGVEYMLINGAAAREAKHAAKPVRLIGKVGDKQLRVIASDGRTRLLVGYNELGPAPKK